MEADKANAADAPTEKKVLALGDRMKTYEATTVQLLDPKLPFIIRLDGHKFSTFTRAFRKPFDDRITNAMTETAKQLLLEFNPATVYTCSDEITLIYPVEPWDPNAPVEEKDKEDAKEKEKVLFFNGKIQKIASLTSAFASVCFDRALNSEKWDPVADEKIINLLATKKPYFDSRVFNVPTNIELVNNLIWRSHYDFRRNSISIYSRQFFSDKEMHGVSSADLLKKIVEGGHPKWEDLPGHYKFGIFVKREKYNKEVEIPDPKDKTKTKTVTATRTTEHVSSFEIEKYTEDYEKFVIAKYVNDTFVFKKE
jgi:tRNA(His) guanylyltransferase